jgi:hypothetical protein
MAQATAIVRFADFSAPLPLREVAKLLSEELFAGVRFTGKDEGIWDEVTAIRLERDFLGLRVVLGGSEVAGYTLEVDTTMSALGDSPAGVGPSTDCDVSQFLKVQLAQIPGVTLLDPKY